MSTVKTTNLQHPSSGSANIQLGSDGSVVLPSGFTGGIGTNVVSATVTGSFITTSTSYVIRTGQTVTITPTSSSSKILVIATTAQNRNSSAGNNQIVAIFADGSEVAGTEQLNTASTANAHNSSSNMVLHSPATTSAVTYDVRVKTNGGTGYFDAGAITAIEVAA